MSPTWLPLAAGLAWLVLGCGLGLLLHRRGFAATTCASTPNSTKRARWVCASASAANAPACTAKRSAVAGVVLDSTN